MTAYLALTITGVVAALGGCAAVAATIVHMRRQPKRPVPTVLASLWLGCGVAGFAVNAAVGDWLLAVFNVLAVATGLAVIAVRRRTVQTIAETDALREQAAQQDRFYRPGMWN